MGKTQNHQHQDQKVKNPSKNRKKTPQTPKGPSSVEDIKAKMQASVEQGGPLPEVEGKFISYVKNCFRRRDQEAMQDRWPRRRSL